MLNYSIDTSHRLLMLMLLVTCDMLVEITWASDVNQPRTERSWSSTDTHSRSDPHKRLRSAVTSSSIDVSEQINQSKHSSFRSIRSTDISQAAIFPPQLSVNRCGMVERIEPVVLNTTSSNYMGAAIVGTVRLPTGQYGAKFFTEIVVPGESGYMPPERNIAEPVYYQISLIADDGNHYVIIQQTAPQFEPGETVRLNSNGFLEKSDCVMREFRRINPDK